MFNLQDPKNVHTCKFNLLESTTSLPPVQDVSIAKHGPSPHHQESWQSIKETRGVSM